MHPHPILACAGLMIATLLISAPTTTARAEQAQFEVVDVPPPSRAPVLIYERIVSAIPGLADELLVVYGDGTVWLHEPSVMLAPPIPMPPPGDVPSRPASDPSPSVYLPPETTPVLQRIDCLLPTVVRRLHVPHESVEELARDLISLGVLQIRGGQGPGLVLDAPLTTVTFIRPHLSRRSHLSWQLGRNTPVANVSRANSFTFYIAEDEVAEVDARIALFIEWVRLMGVPQ